MTRIPPYGLLASPFVEPPIYRPCPVCGAETGVAPLNQCEHVCPGCEGTGLELNNHPCIECAGTQVRRLARYGASMSNGASQLTPRQRAKLQVVRTTQRRLRHAVEGAALALAERDTAVLSALSADIRPSRLAYAVGLSLQDILQICGKDLDGADE